MRQPFPFSAKSLLVPYNDGRFSRGPHSPVAARFIRIPNPLFWIRTKPVVAIAPAPSQEEIKITPRVEVATVIAGQVKPIRTTVEQPFLVAATDEP